MYPDSIQHKIHILLFGSPFNRILAVNLRALDSHIFFAFIGSPVARLLMLYQPTPTDDHHDDDDDNGNQDDSGDCDVDDINNVDDVNVDANDDDNDDDDKHNNNNLQIMSDERLVSEVGDIL